MSVANRNQRQNATPEVAAPDSDALKSVQMSCDDGRSCDASGHGQPLAARVLTFDESCPYLPGRTATLEGFIAGSADPELYRRLLDHGFRRSGRFFYRPRCKGCHECQSLRVPVASFAPSRSQRRCWLRNQDLVVEVGVPRFTAEKYELYCQYVAQKHADQSEKDVAAVSDFLYNSVVDMVEVTCREPGGRLLAVGICDVFADAISSVYCFYDVQPRRRGLGTFTALREIEYARKHGLGYYYLGFLVRDCPSMRYKALYRPYELLDASQRWVAGGVTSPKSQRAPDELSQISSAGV